MWLKRLLLDNFRNYNKYELNIHNKWIYIVGPNGRGKTNILEAISTFVPGKSLRKCNLIEIINDKSSYKKWTVFGEVSNGIYSNEIGISYEVKNIKGHRKIKINGNFIRNSTQLLRYLRVLWVTPQMDDILAGNKTERRNLLDRFTFNFFPDHAESLNKFEYAYKSRLKLLTNNNFDNTWLQNFENTISEESIWIIKRRKKFIDIISEQLQKFNTSFLKPHLSLHGNIESMLKENDESYARNEILKSLLENRRVDSFKGFSSVGSHKSELKVVHPQKNIEAFQTSTGEQKAMLIALIMAQIKTLNEIYNIKPILLLDDIFSHLDKNVVNNLLEELSNLDAQVWITLTEFKKKYTLNNCKDYVKIML